MKIGVFFGSRSPEHDVSIITGTLVYKQISMLGYDVEAVYIDKDGKWFIGESFGDLKFYQNEELKKGFKSKEYNLNLNKSIGRLVFESKTFFKKEEKIIDLVFPTFHGMHGEDGTFQGICEIFNVPYVGCNVLSSAIAMDKIITKLFYQRFNIPTTKFIHFNLSEWEKSKDEILNNISENLVLPLFVKPSKLGSSIGISKIKHLEDLQNGIEVALSYDTSVIVEEGIEDVLDLTVAVRQKENGEVESSEIQESKFSDDFFSYQDKYINEGGSQTGNAEKKIVIPANLRSETTQEIKKTAEEIFLKFGCSGIARVDFLYSKVYDKFYVNEINTMPGTLYHHLWKKSGVTFETLVSDLIKVALKKYKEKNSVKYIFDSEILSKSASMKSKFDV